MQPNEEQLELALDLYRSGVDQDTHMLLTTAHNLISHGWTKGIALTNPIEAVYPVAAPESEVRDPNLNRYQSNESKWRPTNSTRKISEGGIQWGTYWVDPSNVDLPEPGQQRKWSGWNGMNANQKWVMSSFCGEKGRYTLGVQSVINRIKKHATTAGKNGERKHIKPHYLMHSISRRGLVTELDKDVWILTPRGEVYVREILRMEPTGKADGIQTVA